MSTFTDLEFSSLLSYAQRMRDEYHLQHADLAEWAGDFIELFTAIAEGFERMDERQGSNDAGGKLYRGYVAKARKLRDFHLNRLATAKRLAESQTTNPPQ
jgi:hypothetical protein